MSPITAFIGVLDTCVVMITLDPSASEPPAFQIIVAMKTEFNHRNGAWAFNATTHIVRPTMASPRSSETSARILGLL